MRNRGVAADRRLLAALLVASVGLPAGYLVVRASLAPSVDDHRRLVDRYCLDCHNPIDLTADLALDELDLSHPERDADAWEKVIRKLRAGMMPPADAPKPPAEERRALISWLEERLDRAARERPNPGPALVRRLNRAEYENAVRDLLHVEIDATALLPPDDSAYGFDNNAEALGTSPVLVEQYLSAAGEIAALAVGDPTTGPAAQTFRVRQDASQDIPVPGMPLGTVGGGRWRVVLPLDGEYRLDVTYFKSNLGAMKGLETAHEMEIAVDGRRVHSATIGGPEDFAALMRNITEAAEAVEARSSTVVPLTAGPHDISVGFVYQGALQTSVRLQPYLRSSQDILDVTGHPHIETLTVSGPYGATGPGDTPSRQRIFVCYPDAAASEAAERECAREILSTLARRAYRGYDTPHDVDTLMAFFERGRAARGFEGGIQVAIERLLASPKFTFRVERDPPEVAPGEAYPVASRELATRLSFFLWSSIPDDELLELAERDALTDPRVLEAQVRRMLADPKAAALVDNFAGQWLYLRNLESFVPNSVGFPDFDDNLRQGFLTETRLFFESVMREDRNVLDFMTADYTFLNERVARHYGIEGVYGPHFRRVQLEDEARFGLLGKGSVLMVTSHTDRTSPVVRGNWVLTNLLGTPPPPPPPDVPPLEEVVADTLRARLEAHRQNSVCAACHGIMDPIGFALENFDAVGAWRDHEAGIDTPRIDAHARLTDGTEVTGPVELREALLRDPQVFVGTLVEKLMIYALGRGLTADDMPAVRRIVRDAAEDDYRFSEIVLGIVNSVPFRMRVKPEAAADASA
ncbi:MAG TPA: DUF1592 domain-containing protein [Gammaproteobacteria bacterium]